MILKPKDIGQLTDDQLDKKLKSAATQERIYDRAKHHDKSPIAGVIAVGILGVAILIWKLSFASGNPFIMMGGMVAGAAELAVGAVVCSIGWDRIETRMRSLWKKTADDVHKEKAKRAYERTPAFREAMRQAAEATARKIRDVFNAAVDKTFHGGTESDVKVKGALKLKKPGEKPRKKSIFGW